MPDYHVGEWYPARWWKPERGSDSAVPGTYEVLPGGSAKATALEGLSGENRFLPDPNDEQIEILHGNVFGKAVTLVDVRQGRFQGNMGELCKLEYRPRISLEGLHLGTDELLISDAEIVFHDQQAWSQWRAFSGEGPTPAQAVLSPSTVRYIDPPELVATTEYGTITIEDASTIKPGQDFILKYRCLFKISLSSPTLLTDFMRKWILPLDVMIATASGRVGGIESAIFTNREWEIVGEQHPSQRWVKARVGARIKPGDKRKELDWPDMLFTLSDINWPSQAPLIFDIIPRWSYVVEQWAMLLRPEYKLPVARFVSAVQAVEALDRILIEDPADTLLADEVDEVLKAAGWNSRRRRRVKGGLKYQSAPSLEDRLRRRAGDLGSAMESLTGDQTWPARVAKLRNIVSHGLTGSDDLRAITEGSMVGTELLLHLLEGTFLQNLDFSEEIMKQILERRGDYGWRRTFVNDHMHLLPTV